MAIDAKSQIKDGSPFVYNSTTPTYEDGQSGAVQLDANGNLKTVVGAVVVYTDEAFHAQVDTSSSTSAQTVKAGTASKSIYITGVSVSTDTAQSVKLQDNTGTPIVHIPRKFLPANGTWSMIYSPAIKVASAKDLNYVCGGATGNVTVEVDGYVV